MGIFKFENEWLGFNARDYQTIKASILAKFPTKVPEITSLGEHNPFVRMVSVYAAIAEMMGYYMDSIGKQFYFSQATLYDSVKELAYNCDYRIKSYTPASTEILFSINMPTGTDVVIPIRTKVVTAEGVEFYTVVQATIVAGTTQVLVSAKNSAIQSSVVYEFDGTPIDVGSFVSDAETSVSIVSDVYTFVDSFISSEAVDKHFTTTVTEEGNTEIIFGDGVNGYKPTIGSSVTIVVSLTNGVNGILTAGVINQIASSITLPVGVTIQAYNPNSSTGGMDMESLALISKRARIHRHTRGRAVSDKDYHLLAMLVPGVLAAKHRYECTKVVPVYIITSGGDPSELLKKQVLMYFNDKRRMVTTEVEVRAGGIAELVIKADLKVLPNRLNSEAEAVVIEALTSKYSLETQEIGGEVHVGNLYEDTETLKSYVDYLSIKSMTVKPAAIAAPGTSGTLNWERDVKVGSTSISTWYLQFISSTEFKLLNNNVFVGNFNILTTYILPQFSFKILAGTYALNDKYVFTLYPYSSFDLVIQDMSIPVILAENVILSTSGGI